MNFNFDANINRKGTNSIKWDLDDKALPMWVADMDFEIANCIQEALKKRLSHAIFGYNLIPPSFYESIISWWQNFPAVKRVLEINPEHAIIKRLHELYSQNGDSEDLKSVVNLIYDQAILAEGGELADPAGFSAALSKVISKALD